MGNTSGPIPFINMPRTYNTPQEAEDAFYDALDEGKLEQLLSVWSETDDVSCLLPMQPLIRGRQQVVDLFTHIFSQQQRVPLAIAHLGWIETGDTAIHLVEETILDTPPGAPAPPPFYGTNIYRKEANGWRLIVHQNAPTPQPPPGG